MEPIYVKGNWFWRRDDRFLIKGITYLPQTPGSDPWEHSSRIDPFNPTRIEDLKRDIALIKDLGLNTIQVTALQPNTSYQTAMNLLAANNIYVLVTLFENFHLPEPPDNKTPNIDPADHYTPTLLKPVLRLVEEMAPYRNTLAFVLSTNAIHPPGSTKLAELFAAGVRDVKTYLRLHHPSRKVPVGVSVDQSPTLIRPKLEYFTAGSPDTRADFYAMDNWSWISPSDFQISGYKNLVSMLETYPVPMYFSAFGGHAMKPRRWGEVGCIFSPDMTGVFSGGCVHTFFEHGNRYGIVKVADGVLERKAEFGRLKKQLDLVAWRGRGEVSVEGWKDYEGWKGKVPEVGERWKATSDLPGVKGGLERLMVEVGGEGGRRESEEVDAVAERTGELRVE